MRVILMTRFFEGGGMWRHLFSAVGLSISNFFVLPTPTDPQRSENHLLFLSSARVKQEDAESRFLAFRFLILEKERLYCLILTSWNLLRQEP